MTRGILIVACGPECESYAQLAVASCQRWSRLPVHVHHDPDSQGIRSRAVKIRMDQITPFRQTLYIDCDALLCCDPGPIFDLLDHDPLWMAIDVGPRTISEVFKHHFFKEILKPDAEKALKVVRDNDPNYPHFNSGVILFDQRAAPFFAAWRDAWHSLQRGQDQVALMIAGNRLKQRPALLSPRWNFQHSRGKKETDLTTFRDQIRILHLLGGEKPMLYQRAAQAGILEARRYVSPGQSPA